jgi:hypothetical protein
VESALAHLQLGLVLPKRRLTLLEHGLALLKRDPLFHPPFDFLAERAAEAAAASRSLWRVLSGRRKVQFRRIPFVGSRPATLSRFSASAEHGA